MPSSGQAVRLIVLRLGAPFFPLAALVCVSAGLLSAAQCGHDKPPQSPGGVAFQQACDIRQTGRYAEASRGFEQAAKLFHKAEDTVWEARALVYAGGCEFRTYQYTTALEVTEAAAALARRVGADQIAAAALINAASIHAQLGNLSLAEGKVWQAIGYLTRLKAPEPDVLAKAYQSLSYDQIRLGKFAEGMESSRKSIEISAADRKLAAIEASSWDFRGFALLKENQIAKAEECLNTAKQRYQQTGNGQVPALTLQHLAELRWVQGRNQEALQYINDAFKHADAEFNSSALFYPWSLKAHILADLGQTDDALATYREAMRLAARWRRAALPGDIANILAVEQLDGTYHGFAEFAAEQSYETHNESLAREAFDALAENRASTLRGELALELNRNRALPPEYLAKLGELQAVQARVTLAGDSASEQRLQQLQTELSEIETQIGLNSGKIFTPTRENIHVRNSLRDIQIRLGPQEALFSFCLGARHSFLWAVTGSSMNLYRLPASRQISEQVSLLRDGLEYRHAFEPAARKLDGYLFGQIDERYKQKPDWLIVGDGALLDRVPFSVLAGGDSGQPGTILKRHSVRELPSALLVGLPRPEPAQVYFLGLADPLYNLADSRRQHGTARLDKVSARGASALGRLPGSQREIRAAANSSGLPEKRLLVGPDASISSLIAGLEQNPAIVHFAVHVVSPPGHPEQAALALSLGENDVPELLTKEKIASLHVSGSLIVLSGCSSGQGRAFPGEGLVGLSRAWLLAGASAVLVSDWPTPDDSGQFFAIFYSHLADARSGSLATRAAAALQQAQLAMQVQHGYGSSPAFWAAYSIISKE